MTKLEPLKTADSNKPALLALTTAALMLPGLMQSAAHAAEDDEIDFQYSHYQEGNRAGSIGIGTDISTGNDVKLPVPRNRAPIEVDSVHGSARVSLTDRVKFAFNYIEDTWSGATPFASAPAHSSANQGDITIYPDGTIVGGASPWANAQGRLDSQGNPVAAVYDPATGQLLSYEKDTTVHVMGYASPEVRKQGDFKLSYDWDEAAASLGGGISSERDYESRFVNLGGRLDFNQKQTTVNLELSYTNSSVDAVMDPVGERFFGERGFNESQVTFDKATGLHSLHGNRQDWATQLGLTQVINRNAVAALGMGYTRSTGFMENPYKLSWLFAPAPIDWQQGLPPGIVGTIGTANVENRPDQRNQWHWNAGWTHYIEPVDAALHLNYQFAHDDWGINAHTFSGDWVQPLGAGWTLTPHVRYYSQESADFYAPFFKTTLDKNGLHVLPKSFSSDQRLSGYGALSGGLTIAKEFAKGVRLETGIEYYTHQGRLKLGGGGEDNFADFDYWVANAALKVNLSAIGQSSSADGATHHHADHANLPAGLLFGHTLAKADDVMAGYRYQHNRQAGGFLHGERSVSEQQITDRGCPGQPRTDQDGNVIDFNGTNCSMLQREMTMSMHMLELMYAPTDWLTLMLMPQFTDMAMTNYTPESLKDAGGGHGHGNVYEHLHETGGIGDTGLYALVKLFDQPNHHIHASLGVSAPTGDVGIKLKQRTKDIDSAYIHYGMQLGSGTWDFKPSLTYTGHFDQWSWGAQTGGTIRMEDKNRSGYALGDSFQSTAWGNYAINHWLTASLRGVYTLQGAIRGEYNGLINRLGPVDFPGNYGGQYWDIGLGLSAVVPSGDLAGNRLSVEWLQPLTDRVNGYQPERDGALSATWSIAF